MPTQLIKKKGMGIGWNTFRKHSIVNDNIPLFEEDGVKSEYPFNMNPLLMRVCSFSITHKMYKDALFAFWLSKGEAIMEGRTERENKSVGFNKGLISVYLPNTCPLTGISLRRVHVRNASNFPSSGISSQCIQSLAF